MKRDFFIVIVIINPLIKVSFIHVNILPLSPPSLQTSSVGLVSPSSPAQILIKVSYTSLGISNEPLFQIPLEIKVATHSVVLFISMVLFFEYRDIPMLGDFCFILIFRNISHILHWHQQHMSLKVNELSK